MSTQGTGYATVVYPPVQDRDSVYPLPECVKGWEPKKFFPLQLRKHRKGVYIYHPFASKSGFISFDDHEEAQAYIKARGYELVYFGEFRMPGEPEQPQADAAEVDEDDEVTGGPRSDISHYDSAVSEADQY